MRYFMSQHEIFHELKVSEMSSSISEISDLSILSMAPVGAHAQISLDLYVLAALLV